MVDIKLVFLSFMRWRIRLARTSPPLIRQVKLFHCWWHETFGIEQIALRWSGPNYGQPVKLNYVTYLKPTCIGAPCTGSCPHPHLISSWRQGSLVFGNRTLPAPGQRRIAGQFPSLIYNNAPRLTSGFAQFVNQTSKYWLGINWP